MIKEDKEIKTHGPDWYFIGVILLCAAFWIGVFIIIKLL